MSNKQHVINTIADSQDGGRLSVNHDDWSTFILNRIDDNTNNEDEVDVETLIQDFKYMINQLEMAIKSLQ